MTEASTWTTVLAPAVHDVGLHAALHDAELRSRSPKETDTSSSPPTTTIPALVNINYVYRSGDDGRNVGGRQHANHLPSLPRTRLRPVEAPPLRVRRRRCWRRSLVLDRRRCHPCSRSAPTTDASQSSRSSRDTRSSSAPITRPREPHRPGRRDDRHLLRSRHDQRIPRTRRGRPATSGWSRETHEAGTRNRRSRDPPLRLGATAARPGSLSTPSSSRAPATTRSTSRPRLSERRRCRRRCRTGNRVLRIGATRKRDAGQHGAPTTTAPPSRARRSSPQRLVGEQPDVVRVPVAPLLARPATRVSTFLTGTGSSYTLQDGRRRLDPPCDVTAQRTAAAASAATSAASGDRRRRSSRRPDEHVASGDQRGRAAGADGDRYGGSLVRQRDFLRLPVASHARQVATRCVDIGSATARATRPRRADVRGTLRVRVTASNGSGSASADSAQTPVVTASAAAVAAAAAAGTPSLGAPANFAAPTISGLAKKNQALTAASGGLDRQSGRARVSVVAVQCGRDRLHDDRRGNSKHLRRC